MASAWLVGKLIGKYSLIWHRKVDGTMTLHKTTIQAMVQLELKQWDTILNAELTAFPNNNHRHCLIIRQHLMKHIRPQVAVTPFAVLALVIIGYEAPWVPASVCDAVMNRQVSVIMGFEAQLSCRPVTMSPEARSFWTITTVPALLTLTAGTTEQPY